uniref:TAP binding protein like n=1 Tax=Ornithorhynchus anatinus TaxID=9258 RepID=A0A6I8NBH8_ORNAN
GPGPLASPAPSVRIPQAQALLHADCEGEKVACEISPYFPRGGPGAAAWFIGTLHVSGSGPHVSLVMRIPKEVREGAALHPKLRLPLSPQGTVLATVEFQVSTRTAALHSRLGGSSALHCSFSIATDSGPLSVDWRLQHKGRGRAHRLTLLLPFSRQVSLSHPAQPRPPSPQRLGVKGSYGPLPSFSLPGRGAALLTPNTAKPQEPRAGRGSGILCWPQSSPPSPIQGVVPGEKLEVGGSMQIPN